MVLLYFTGTFLFYTDSIGNVGNCFSTLNPINLKNRSISLLDTTIAIFSGNQSITSNTILVNNDPLTLTPFCFPKRKPGSRFSFFQQNPFGNFPQVVCNQSFISFRDSSWYEPETWHWIFPPEADLSQADSSCFPNITKVRFTQSGIFPIKLVTTNEMGTDTLTKFITVINFIPQPNLGNDTTLCVGDSLRLIYKAVPNSDHYFTKVGGGLYSTKDTIFIKSPGLYICAAFSSCGFKYDTILVQFAGKPKAGFIVQNNCNSLSVVCTDTSNLNDNQSLLYNWNFYSKNNVLIGSSQSKNSSFNFSSFDTVKIQLIAKANNACAFADTLIKTFVLKAKPTAAFAYTNNCGSLSAAFNNLSLVTADTLSSYFWNFGDGTVSVDKNPIHSFTAYGNYMVKLVVTSSLGCISDTFSLPVLIKAKPVANFIYSNNGCAGSPVLLQDSAFVTNSSITTHYWLLPNGSSLNTVHINPTFTVGGNYLIKYVVSSAQGCISDTLAKSVLIESIPVASIAAVKDGCVNTPLALSSASTIATGQINSFAWQVGNFTANTANPNFTFTNFGNYNISLVVTSNNGCVSNTASAAVNIQTNPVTAFNNTLVCINKPVNFTNNSNNIFGSIVSSEWLVNNTLISTNSNGFNYTFNQNGNYVISLKSTTANGCSTIATKNILVEPALANAGRDTTVLENQPFVLQGSGGATYFWQPPIGLDNITKANPTGILNNNQQYVLRATTAQGCISFDTVVITVLRNLKIPNAFSPNGDGINETWGIEQLKDYPNAVVQIFNRNGQLMFTAKGNNTTAWNGTINNQPVPVGTYYYVITLNNLLRNKPISGWVMVVR
ncbi:MAG: PKD domain-containing protein [Chitinophagaceae bacterium]|nr:PKD domain-containing protein [Chitinophagaceae bacterium]